MENIITHYGLERKQARKARVITLITSVIGFALTIAVFTGAFSN